MKSEQIPTLVQDDVSHGVFTVRREIFTMKPFCGRNGTYF